MTDYNLGDVRYFIDHDKRILYAERHDNITKEGVYAEWKAIQQLDGFDPSYETIVDYSFVPCVDLDAHDLMELKKNMSDYDVRTNHVAIVTGELEGRYMLAKFFCTISNLIYQRKNKVFKTKAEAELWLFSLREHE
jgi:hypothetical protein